MSLSVPDSAKRPPKFTFPESKALQRAIASGSTRIMRYLLRQRCDVNAMCGRQRLTPLMFGCYMTDADKRCAVVDMLLSNGADASLTDRKGWNALFYACAMGVVDVAARLLKSPNVDLAAVDVEGNTALHISAMEGHTKIVVMLLKEMRKYGTPINVYNCYGCTPLTVALYNGHTECAAILHEVGGFPKLYENDFPRVVAMSYSQPEFVKESLLAMMPAGSRLSGSPRRGKHPTFVTTLSHVKRAMTVPELGIHSYSKRFTRVALPYSSIRPTAGHWSHLSSVLRNRRHTTSKPPQSVAFKRTQSYQSTVSQSRHRSATLPPPTITYQRTQSLERTRPQIIDSHTLKPLPVVTYQDPLPKQGSVSKHSAAHRQRTTYPCNEIISALLHKVGPPQRTSGYPSQIKAMSPISPEWIEAVLEYKKLIVPTLPPQPSPQPSPLRMPLQTPQPTTPQPATPQPTTPQPGTPQPATQQPATPQPATPQPATPQPATPQPATPQPATPQPATPQSSTPLPDTPQTQITTPQRTTPPQLTAQSTAASFSLSC